MTISVTLLGYTDYVLGTVLSALHKLIHMILTTTLWGKS